MKNLQIPVRKLQVIPQVLPEPYDQGVLFSTTSCGSNYFC